MMHELACELIDNGHDVVVITPDSNISSLNVDYLDKVKVYRFRSGKIKNVSKIKRAINETLLSYNAWKDCKNVLRDNPCDLIIYYSPSIFWGPLVYKLKKIWNAKTYLILRDFFPQWAIDNKLLSEKSFITCYFKLFEKINYSVADKIGVMSDKNMVWFNSYYDNNKKTEVLYNWIKIKDNKQKDNKYKKLLNLENKIVYFYGGNLGQAQDMMNIVRLAINMIDEKEAHFVLVGAGDEFELVNTYIKQNNIINITLLPSVSQEEYLIMLSDFDIGIFTLNSKHTTHNFPGKLLGYMNSRMPILGSVNPQNDLKDLLEEFNAGLISINADDKLFYDNAITLLSKEKRDSISINAFKLLQSKFSVKSAAFSIINSISE